jgi:hypothetical protein
MKKSRVIHKGKQPSDKGIEKTAKATAEKLSQPISKKVAKSKKAAVPESRAPRSAANDLDDIFASAKIRTEVPKLKQVNL